MVQETFPELMWTNKTKLFEDDDVTVYIHFKYSEIIAGNGQMTSLKSIFLLLRSKVQDSYVRNPQDKKHSYFHYWSRKSKHC